MTDGALKPSREARVIVALGRLHAADVGLIEQHALKITGAMLQVLAASRAKGFKIGLDSGGAAFAEPMPKTAGIARALRDVTPKCRKAAQGKIGLPEWTAIWAAQPAFVTALVWPNLVVNKMEHGRRVRTLAPASLCMGFQAEGFATIAPDPVLILPILEAALTQITRNPRSAARVKDPDEASAIDAVRSAYAAITGHLGGRVIDNEGRLAGRMIRLGRDIDHIFGTKLFSARDGRRFR